MLGFLNVYKPSDMTSHDVIAVLRKILKIKQIGHTGTLDPFARGVLPVAIGKATRLIEYLEDEKEYLAQVQFGKATNTYDLEGEPTFECTSTLDSTDVALALAAFRGEILQLPPIYSAIKVKGKKLYEYARKGESVEIEPRKVFIEKIELKDFDEKNQQASIIIKCSKGTYIRSIAHDLGQMLKVGAHLVSLERTQAGKFFVANSINLSDITSSEIVMNNLINPLSVLVLPQLQINEVELNRISLGQPIENKGKLEKNIGADFVLLIYNNEIKAVAKLEAEQIKVKKVFL